VGCSCGFGWGNLLAFQGKLENRNLLLGETRKTIGRSCRRSKAGCKGDRGGVPERKSGAKEEAALRAAGAPNTIFRFHPIQPSASTGQPSKRSESVAPQLTAITHHQDVSWQVTDGLATIRPEHKGRAQIELSS